MTFRLRTPQDAIDEIGRRVYVKARNRVAFEAGTRTAEVEVEFGRVVTIYRSTLTIADGPLAPPTAEVLLAMAGGLTAMGCAVEVIE